VPDLAGWLRSRLSAVPATPFIELPPDWACEVVSPGGERIVRERKLPIYARKRVSHVWLVEPFAAIEIELDALWPTPPAEPRALPGFATPQVAEARAPGVAED
jgi:Uma2 family endonuclease